MIKHMTCEEAVVNMQSGLDHANERIGRLLDLLQRAHETIASQRATIDGLRAALREVHQHMRHETGEEE